MSAEIEELAVLQPEENANAESSKKSIRSYSRDFLLSFSEFEVCKKLPADFDESLLSEFHGTSYYGSLDRPRALGSSPSQGFRRTDYGSPPTRGESGSYSRGLQRWDSRSSGKSEGDSDTDSGRRIGNQARRTWQNAEHDGLLGSGSFPRPPGFAAGGAVPRFRPNENVQLSKSNEPYQPPRPYKAGPYSRRETRDSFNDETFGSSDSTSEDRAEEEKKRRAEFELMRKEQHKAFEENLKLNPGKPKDSFSEMARLQENPSDIPISSNSDKVVKETPHDASKFSVSAQALPTRPLVPPGFVSGLTDKSSAMKSHVHADAQQVENLEVEQGHQNVKCIPQERGSSDWFGEMSNSSNLKAKKDLSSILLGTDQARASALPGVTEALENGESLGFDSEINGHKMLCDPVRSTSILDKLLDNQSTMSCESTSNIVEGDDPKTVDIWSPDKLQSKFTRWFREEDKKTSGNASLEKPNSMLSLIFGGEKVENDDLNGVPTASVLPPEIILGRTASKSASSTGEVPQRFGSTSTNVSVPKASVLTCEDLEQSMLSEISGDIPRSRSLAKEQGTFEVEKDGLPGDPVDNSASQHLLSLLQGGMSLNNTTSMFGLTERLPGEDQKLGKSGLPESSTTSTREANQSDKSLTLEALFGTAFMTELHSAQRTSVGSTNRDVPDGEPFPLKMGENGDGIGGHERSILASNNGITKSTKTSDWLDFHDTGMKVDHSRLPSEADAKFGGFDRGIEARIPQEVSLINLADPTSAENSVWIPNSSSYGADLRSSLSNTSINVMEGLAAHSGARTDERSMIGFPDPLSLHSPYDMGKLEMPYQNLQPQSQASFAQLHQPQINQNRTPFHPLSSHPAHIDPHMKFIPPESGIQFPTNMGHPSFPNSSSLPTFNHHIPPVLQQMNMAGNHPPPQLVRAFPGAAPMPPHPSHTPAGFIQEHNPMHGFPFGQRQPNFGGHGMTPPGPELGVSNSPPEAFQRLLEMEMRANPKQVHPFATGGPTEAMYGHALYR
ncbi:hypothetical protein RND81_02G126300 [Saponaria officinalis]|uniref:Uncharacterized protein n=1 Tax=Saponaria officinalis TaxID=3572 RepID=A0AAW1MV70_SAPOF